MSKQPRHLISTKPAMPGVFERAERCDDGGGQTVAWVLRSIGQGRVDMNAVVYLPDIKIGSSERQRREKLIKLAKLAITLETEMTHAFSRPHPGVVQLATLCSNHIEDEHSVPIWEPCGVIVINHKSSRHIRVVPPRRQVPLSADGTIPLLLANESRHIIRATPLPTAPEGQATDPYVMAQELPPVLIGSVEEMRERSSSAIGSFVALRASQLEHIVSPRDVGISV